MLQLSEIANTAQTGVAVALAIGLVEVVKILAARKNGNGKAHNDAVVLQKLDAMDRAQERSAELTREALGELVKCAVRQTTILEGLSKAFTDYAEDGRAAMRQVEDLHRMKG